MRIVQRDLVVLQSRAPVERFDDPARFAENDLSGGRIPFVGVRRADVNFDGTFGQQAEFERTALLDDLDVYKRQAIAIYIKKN